MLPALIVGALTAWYLGVRIGVIVAIATFVALLTANFVPGLNITVYALVIAWFAGESTPKECPQPPWLLPQPGC